MDILGIGFPYNERTG